MLTKFNTFARLLTVLLLIYPIPVVMGAEVTVNEDFSDNTYQAGLTISGGNSDAFIYTGENDSYGTAGNSLGISTGTYLFEFSSDIDVYEVGFMIGAVNNAYSVTWNYADSTSETENKSGQSTSDFDNMYDDFYKSFTDYNNDEANTDKFITSFAVTIGDISLLDTLYWQYDDSTSTGSFATTTTTTLVSGIGDPTNLTVSANLHSGDISIDWDAATGYQYNAERYAIGFDKADPPMYGIATGNVGDENALNTEYTFSKSYLQSVLDAQVGDTIYFKIRADNDTNSQYSSWTTIASYTIQDVASGVTDLEITNNEYQGLKFGWTQPNTGWSAVESYRIEYKLSSEETYTGIDIADASTVSYLIEDIKGGTYDFVVYSCTQNGSYCHGGQAGPTTNFEVLTTTATTTTTTTTTLAPVEEVYVEPYVEPEPPPEEIIVDVVIEGVDKTYTQADVNDGTTSRDQERADNEDMYGCFMTNAQIDRGDCESIEIYEVDDDYVDDDDSENPETDDSNLLDDTKIVEDKEEEIFYEIDGKILTEEEFIEFENQMILEMEEELKKQLENDTFVNDGWVDEEKLDEFIDVIIEIEKNIDFEEYEYEEEILIIDIDIEDIILIIEDETTLPTDKENLEDEETNFPEDDFDKVPSEEGSEEVLFPEPIFVEEVSEEVQLTEEEVEIFLEETETAIAEVVEIPVESIEIIEEEVLETLTDEEVEAYEEIIEEVVVAIVEELETDEQVKVIEAVAKASVQDLAKADTTTKAVVQAIVNEVTTVETVAELTEEQKETVGAVLGFKEDTAAEDVGIISEQAAKDENTAQAVDEYVERAIENTNVENYTLADVVTEIQIEAFVSNPIGALVDVQLDEIVFSEIGKDMTSDQKEKAQEVVIPVIIASQIISQAGALMTRRF